mgnify:CR=1 FL=1
MNALTLQTIEEKFSNVVPTKKLMELILKDANLTYLVVTRNKHGFALSNLITNDFNNVRLLGHLKNITAASFFKAINDLRVDIKVEEEKAKKNKASLITKIKKHLDNGDSISELSKQYEQELNTLNFLAFIKIDTQH